MHKRSSLLSGAGLGAGLMYVFDPVSGNRRRKMAAAKVASLAHASQERLGKLARHLASRCRGLAATAGRAFRREAVSDEVLVARVASRLGRHASHAGAIGITAEDGRVTLAGPVLAREADDLLRAARKTRGVRAVDNQLEIHENADGVPSLQGGPPCAGLAH